MSKREMTREKREKLDKIERLLKQLQKLKNRLNDFGRVPRTLTDRESDWREWDKEFDAIEDEVALLKE